ncbi:DUF3021 domain-containing protein [Paenibacillus monticola]|uniref:DUF3021 domain-containing protein n=1 Tax=Paenibacillus monticola TaxID=2666075 RepID=A0A7X2H3L9_9BACL|nr:DUF3021 domain-containing protein [Paenibacillus monticola]MRN52947.1 DUF3021 domain-containing protein [Paenibacillus monticola]
MKISKYLSYMLKDFLIASGFLTVIAAIVLALSSSGTIQASLLGQIVLIAAAFTCFKYALVNTHELGKKAGIISFYVCFIMADVFLILWLWFFSSRQIFDRDLLLSYTVVILLVKGVVFTMMHMDGQNEAKQLNQKLSEYKNSEDKRLV